MTPFALWTIAALNVTALVIGGVEWFRRRRGGLLLAGALNTSAFIPILLGDAHPVWRGACWVVGLALATSIFIRLRRTIRWSSLPVVFGGTTILLIGVTELATDVMTGVPRVVTIGLVTLLVVSFISCFASMGWEVGRMVLRARHATRHKA